MGEKAIIRPNLIFFGIGHIKGLSVGRAIWAQRVRVVSHGANPRSCKLERWNYIRLDSRSEYPLGFWWIFGGCWAAAVDIPKRNHGRIKLNGMIHLSESEKPEARATALTENSNRLLADRTTSMADKRRAVSALMAAEWTPSTVRSIGPKALTRLLHLIRSGIFSGAEYRTFADMIVRAQNRPLPILHGQWELWEAVVIRSHLYEISAEQDWQGLIARFDSRGIHSTHHLVRIPIAELIKADREIPNTDMLIWICQSTRGDSSPYRPNLPFRLGAPNPDLRRMIYSIRKKDIDATQIAIGYDRLQSSIGLASSFESLSTSGKCDLIPRPGASTMVIIRLLNLGSQRNTIRAFAGSLRPAAPFVQSYKNFRDFANRPAFPAEADTVLLWSALFPPWETFGLYLVRVMKAAVLLGQPTDWLTPKVKSGAEGLRHAAVKSFPFDNFMMAPDLLPLIKFVKLTTDFGLSAFLSFLLLRVPSETMRIRRASDVYRLTEFPPHDFKIMAGIRPFSGSSLLIAKFPKRGNLPRGCILRRPCLCGEASLLARAFCPAHQIWPRLRERAEVRGLFHRSLSASKFNMELRRGMLGAGYADGGKYSPHCFRRGATQELQIAESPTDSIKRTGCWTGMGFRSYIDTQLTDALKISRLMTRIADSDSDADIAAPGNMAAETSLRKRPRASPLCQKRIRPQD